MSKFEEELCGCFSDLPVMLFGLCIPGGYLCLQAQAVNLAYGTGPIVPYFLVCCLACIGGAINRGKIRDIYGYHGGFLGDMMLWWYCAPCAGCQEYREVKRRKH